MGHTVELLAFNGTLTLESIVERLVTGNNNEIGNTQVARTNLDEGHTVGDKASGFAERPNLPSRRHPKSVDSMDARSFSHRTPRQNHFLRLWQWAAITGKVAPRPPYSR